MATSPTSLCSFCTVYSFLFFFLSFLSLLNDSDHSTLSLPRTSASVSGPGSRSPRPYRLKSADLPTLGRPTMTTVASSTPVLVPWPAGVAGGEEGGGPEGGSGGGEGEGGERVVGGRECGAEEGKRGWEN